MIIAIVINKSWNIYNFRMGLIQAFLRNGHKIIAIAPEDEYSRLLIQNGCDFIPVSMDQKGKNPLNDLKLIYNFWKIYKKVAPDAILQYTIKPNIYGTIAAKILGIPTINNVSGLGTVFLHHTLSSAIAQKLYKFSFQFAKKVFFQNEEDRQLFLTRKLVSSKITDVLPGSGVNIKDLYPKPYNRNKTFTFLVIARLLYDKGIVEYAEAAKKLKAIGIKANFQLLGFTDFNTTLGIPESLLSQWKADHIIDYLGTTDNVSSFINEADCVVLPSYREGTPRTLLEAASLGKPLITTDVPGCREVVFHDYNGFLCIVKDSEDLADKMLKMLNKTDEELIQFGTNSRALIEKKFDEQFVFQKYFETLGLTYNP